MRWPHWHRWNRAGQYQWRMEMGALCLDVRLCRCGAVHPLDQREVADLDRNADLRQNPLDPRSPRIQPILVVPTATTRKE